MVNAANEEAVALFLARKIGFLDISRLAERALALPGERPEGWTVEDVLAADRLARDEVRLLAGV